MSKAAGSVTQSAETNTVDEAAGDVTFAERLRESMAEADLTAADLARRVQEFIPDFSPGNTSHYLAGRSAPRSNVLKAISRVLGVNPADLRVACRSPRNGQRKPPAVEPAAAEAEPADFPALNLRDLGGGNALPQINQKVLWHMALQILQMLKCETK